MKKVINKIGMPVSKTVPIIFLAIIAFSAGVYLYTNNQAAKEKEILNNQIIDSQNEISSIKKDATMNDKNTNWKTYTNTRYGYSFQYPDTMKLSAGVESGDPSTLPEVHGISILPDSPHSTDEDSIFYIEGSEDTEFTAAAIRSQFDTFFKTEDISITPTTIAGAEAYKVIISESSYADHTLYFIQSPNGTVLNLDIVNSSSEAQKILSSLKFTGANKTEYIPVN